MMNMVADSAFAVNRNRLVVSLLGEPSDEKAYWLSRSPAERWRAVELIRQVLYGYDPATAGLRRVLTVAERA
jgi:hypothetical protein